MIMQKDGEKQNKITYLNNIYLLPATTLTRKFIWFMIIGAILNKIDTVLSKIIKQYRNILEENPNFTGSVTTDFCSGGVTSISKKEKIKIK